MSDSVRPHRLQPTRLLCPWDSPGKNTGVGCHCLLQCVKVKSESEVAQSCPILSDPMDSSLPGSSVHGIFFQARVLEWVPLPSPVWGTDVSSLLSDLPGHPRQSHSHTVLADVPLGPRCGLCESWALVSQERCRLQSSISDANFSAC